MVQILFASLAMAGRFVLRELPAGGLVLMRVVGASLVLVAINWLRGGPWVRRRPDLAWLTLLGLLGIAANQSLFLFGLRYSTAINATILVATTPVFTVLGSVLLGREPASPMKFAGIALAAAGTVYLIGPDRISLAPEVALGNALIVLGMICYAAYFLLSKRLVGRYDSLTMTTYVMLGAIVGVLPVGMGGLLDLHPAQVRPITWMWAGYIVVFPTICTYLLNLWALRRVSSNVVASFIYLQPILTAAIAPLVLTGEHLTVRVVAAGLTIFAGLGFVLWAEWRQHWEVPLPE
ncbi:MAG TPA: DMT family transporter [Gemmatimonadales bacterium]|nr:DMT family transporter [Gemmatimonadales bacterium]